MENSIKLKNIYNHYLLNMDDLNEINTIESIRDNLMCLMNDNIDFIVDDIINLIHPELNDLYNEIKNIYVKYNKSYNINEIKNVYIVKNYTCKYELCIQTICNCDGVYRFGLPYFERDNNNDFIGEIKPQLIKIIDILYGDEIFR